MLRDLPTAQIRIEAGYSAWLLAYLASPWSEYSIHSETSLQSVAGDSR